MVKGLLIPFPTRPASPGMTPLCVMGAFIRLSCLRTARRVTEKPDVSYTKKVIAIQMKRMLRSLAPFAFGWGVLMLAQPASARTQDDCEAIKDWHAYNLCLSSFGPRLGQRAAVTGPAAADPERRVYGRKRQAARGSVAAVPGLNVQRIAGGRMRATFDVAGPRRAMVR